MRNLRLAPVMLVIACLLSAKPAWSQEPMPPRDIATSADSAREQLGAAAQVGGQQQVDAASPGGKPAATPSRYRKINGLWWYWLPNNQWTVWDGKQWSTPSQKSSAYQEWRHQQFADRYNRSPADDEAMRRREIDRWRSQAVARPQPSFGHQANTEYQGQIDRMHDTLMITPYDYRIGTAGHGLFEVNPDRVIGNSGRFNYATSTGGFMGGALRSPYGY
jgi:hypothetical protein